MTLNLTPQPLSKREARLLAEWWEANLWTCTLMFAYRRLGKAYWNVKAEK